MTGVLGCLSKVLLLVVLISLNTRQNQSPRGRLTDEVPDSV